MKGEAVADVLPAPSGHPDEAQENTRPPTGHRDGSVFADACGPGSELPLQPVCFLQAHGVNSSRRSNAWILDEDSFVFVSGRQVVVHRFLDNQICTQDSASDVGASPPSDQAKQELAAYSSMFSPPGALRRTPVFLEPRHVDCTRADPWILREAPENPKLSDDERLPADAGRVASGVDAARDDVSCAARAGAATLSPSCADVDSFVLHYAAGEAGSGGISTVAVDHFHELLAVCEWSTVSQPCIHIYSTRTFERQQMLRGGSSNGFSCAAFRGHECFQSASETSTDGQQQGSSAAVCGRASTEDTGASANRDENILGRNSFSLSSSFARSASQASPHNEKGSGAAREGDRGPEAQEDLVKRGSGTLAFGSDASHRRIRGSFLSPFASSCATSSAQEKVGAPGTPEGSRKETSADSPQMSFSSESTIALATVGCAPDFYLTLWNVREGVALLRFKASTQDVFTVQWSSLFPSQLVTAGARHIKLWSVAKTFTGLKLQAQACKFGALALSDVQSFVDLADGWLLSGSEYGQLLLWEGALVKAEMKQAVATVVPGRARSPAEAGAGDEDPKGGHDSQGEKSASAGPSTFPPSPSPVSAFDRAADANSAGAACASSGSPVGYAGPLGALGAPSASAGSAPPGKRLSILRDDRPDGAGRGGRRASMKVNCGPGAALDAARRGSRKGSLTNALGWAHRGEGGVDGRERGSWIGEPRSAEPSGTVVVVGVPCHAGVVSSVFRDPNDTQKIVTAGHDGCMKWWAAEEILAGAAEADEKMTVVVALLRCVRMPDKRGIRHVAVSPRFRRQQDATPSRWIIEDLAGAVWSYTPLNDDLVKLLDVHASAITGIAPLLSTFAVETFASPEALGDASWSLPSASAAFGASSRPEPQTVCGSSASAADEDSGPEELLMADASVLATTGADGTLRVWRDAHRGRAAVSRRWNSPFTCLQCLPFRLPARSPRFAPAGACGASSSAPISFPAQRPPSSSFSSALPTASASCPAAQLFVSNAEASALGASQRDLSSRKNDPVAEEPGDVCIATGSADGVFRVIRVSAEEISVVCAIKTHASEIKALACAEGGRCIAVLGADNKVFFLRAREMDTATVAETSHAGAAKASSDRAEARAAAQGSSLRSQGKPEGESREATGCVLSYAVSACVQEPETIKQVLWESDCRALLVTEAATLLQVSIAAEEREDAANPKHTAGSPLDAKHTKEATAMPCADALNLRAAAVRRFTLSLPAFSALRRLQRTKPILAVSPLARVSAASGSPSDASSSAQSEASLPVHAQRVANDSSSDSEASAGEEEDEGFDTSRVSSNDRRSPQSVAKCSRDAPGALGALAFRITAATLVASPTILSAQRLPRLSVFQRPALQPAQALTAAGTRLSLFNLCRREDAESREAERSSIFSRSRPSCAAAGASALYIAGTGALSGFLWMLKIKGTSGKTMSSAAGDVFSAQRASESADSKNSQLRSPRNSDAGAEASPAVEEECLVLSPIANLVGLYSTTKSPRWVPGPAPETSRRRRAGDQQQEGRVLESANGPAGGSSGASRVPPDPGDGTAEGDARKSLEGRGREGAETTEISGRGKNRRAFAAGDGRGNEEGENSLVVHLLEKVPDRDLLLAGMSDGRLLIVHLKLHQIGFVLPAFDCQGGPVSALGVFPLRPVFSEYKLAVARAVEASQRTAQARRVAQETREAAAKLARQVSASAEEPERLRAASIAAEEAGAAEAAAAGAERELDVHLSRLSAYEGRLLLLAGARDGTWSSFQLNETALEAAAEAECAKLLARLRERAERKMKKRAAREAKEKEFARQQARELDGSGEEENGQVRKPEKQDEDGELSDGDDDARESKMLGGVTLTAIRTTEKHKITTDLCVSWMVDVLVAPRGMHSAREAAASRKRQQALARRSPSFLSCASLSAPAAAAAGQLAEPERVPAPAEAKEREDAEWEGKPEPDGRKGDSAGDESVSEASIDQADDHGRSARADSLQAAGASQGSDDEKDERKADAAYADGTSDLAGGERESGAKVVASSASPSSSSSSSFAAAGSMYQAALAAVQRMQERERLFSQLDEFEAAAEAATSVSRAEQEASSAILRKEKDEEERKIKEQTDAERNDACKDVTDAAALSLEQIAHHRHREQEVRDAEQKKAEMYAKIAELQKRYADIWERRKKLPFSPGEDEALLADPEFLNAYKAELSRTLDAQKAKLTAQLKIVAIGLRKLVMRFPDRLSAARVYAFFSDLAVETVPCMQQRSLTQLCSSCDFAAAARNLEGSCAARDPLLREAPLASACASEDVTLSPVHAGLATASSLEESRRQGAARSRKGSLKGERQTAVQQEGEEERQANDDRKGDASPSSFLAESTSAVRRSMSVAPEEDERVSLREQLRQQTLLLLRKRNGTAAAYGGKTRERSHESNISSARPSFTDREPTSILAKAAPVVTAVRTPQPAPAGGAPESAGAGRGENAAAAEARDGRFMLRGKTARGGEEEGASEKERGRAARAPEAASSCGDLPDGAGMAADGLQENGVRAELRAERWRQKERLQALKPDEAYTDPVDEQRIEDAVRSMGYQRMKTDECYAIESMVNARTKQEEIRRLLGFLQDRIVAFNVQIYALSDRRAALSREVKSGAALLRASLRELGVCSEAHGSQEAKGGDSDSRDGRENADLLATLCKHGWSLVEALDRLVSPRRRSGHQKGETRQMRKERHQGDAAGDGEAEGVAEDLVFPQSHLTRVTREDLISFLRRTRPSSGEGRAGASLCASASSVASGSQSASSSLQSSSSQSSSSQSSSSGSVSFSSPRVATRPRLDPLAVVAELPFGAPVALAPSLQVSLVHRCGAGACGRCLHEDEPKRRGSRDQWCEARLARAAAADSAVLHGKVARASSSPELTPCLSRDSVPVCASWEATAERVRPDFDSKGQPSARPRSFEELHTLELQLFFAELRRRRNSVALETQGGDNKASGPPWETAVDDDKASQQEPTRSDARWPDDANSRLTLLLTARRRGLAQRVVEVVEQIRVSLHQFDRDVHRLHAERGKLMELAKLADLQHLVLLEELELLKLMEEEDYRLHERRREALGDREAVRVRLERLADDLLEKKGALEEVQATEEAIRQKLGEVIGPKNAFTAHLVQIFNRKVKKARRPQPAGVDDEDDEEEDLRRFDDDDADDDDGDLEEDAAPPGCDMQSYENVLELRDIKTETELKLAALKKEIEEIKKELTRQTALEKQHTQRVKQTEEEIHKYQKEKQKRANQMQQVVPLTASQIECLYTDDSDACGASASGVLPPDLQKEVVFTRAGFGRLFQRIKDLRIETEATRAEYRDLTRSFAVSQKEKKQTIKLIERLTQKFQDVQLLRFGEDVTLEQLEEATATVEAAKEREYRRANLEDRTHASQEAQALAEKRRTIEELSKTRYTLLQENTKLLKTVANLKESEILLQQALGKDANAAAGQDWAAKAQRTQRVKKLKEVLRLQEKEIETLKKEIELFKQKGAHIDAAVLYGPREPCFHSLNSLAERRVPHDRET
ncbi:hypothetical protein BESB_006750 [Besnoitia besnoiti]|uniref:WD domain, G-beta repeat-containing protein n=1 Tax=Besnoitia besnoiti TaxID=94643 RepID=A0A2A9MM19_BESBE|nr:hypothetical protein BESB_006750 [Besnoitia besnoiti]PFH38334.1 hypothetical protein BESB_006750 [Besnoitia besnoiti]